MYTVIIDRKFEASHAVMMPDGEMEPVHSHEWHLKVSVCAEKLDKFGFAVEFGELQELIQSVVSRFEGKNINLMQEFKNCCPTTERIVEMMYNGIKCGLTSSVNIDCVELMESAGCWVRYKE